MTAKNQLRGRITFAAPNIALLLALAFVTALGALPARAAKLKVLYTFTGGADGGFPNGSLIEDAKGNLYGTAELGGNLNCAPPGGCGTVFELTKAGKFIVLHTFAGGKDGASPYATLLMDAAGNLYGTTSAGGGASGCFGNGCGTVFKISPKGKETVLYRFQGTSDGGQPYSTLIMDAKGNFYGTTAGGGDVGCNAPYGCGTVFKMTKTGKETVLYSFTGGTDGAYPPNEALTVDAKGNFYGTTSQGGDPSCNPPNGCGTVFKLAKSGKETVLHAFTGATRGPGPADGAFPESGVTYYGHHLYGDTILGGDSDLGTVYSLYISGEAYKNLYSLKGGPTDGEKDYGALLGDTLIKDRLWFVAAYGGDLGDGALCRINTDGTEKLVVSFNLSVTGAYPLGQPSYSAARKSIVFSLRDGGSTDQGQGAGTIDACSEAECM